MPVIRRTFTFVKREYISKVFTRAFLIGTLFGPLIIMAFYGIPVLMNYYGEEGTLILQYVDRSGRLGAEIETAFDDTLASGAPRFILAGIDTALYTANEASFLSTVTGGTIDALVIIPASVLTGGRVRVMAGGAIDHNLRRLLQERFNEGINRLRLKDAGLDPARVAELTAAVPLSVTHMQADGREGMAGEVAVGIALFFSMILYITILTYGTMVLRGVIEEKSSRIMEVLLSTSDPFYLMMGKLFGIGFAGLTQYLIWVLMTAAVLAMGGLASPAVAQYFALPVKVLAYFVLFFLLAYFQFAAMYAAIGAMCSSPEDAQPASAPVLLLIIIPFLVSLSLGLDSPDSMLSKALSILPFFAPLLMFVRIVVGQPGGGEIALSITTNLGAIILLTWMAARIYRIGVLMYGKRISLREAMRWLRYR